MSDEQDGRIEIELTSHAPVADRDVADAAMWASAVPDAPAAPVEEVVDRDVGDERGWLSSERSRLAVTAGVVGVIALLLGWMLGRSGGDDAATGPAATVAEPASPTTVDTDRSERFEEADKLPEADVEPDELVESRPSIPVISPPIGSDNPATAPGDSVVDGDDSVIQIDERLLGRDVTLITTDRERRLLEIDLSTGAVTQRGDQLPSVASSLIAGPGWVASVHDGSGLVLVDADGGSRTEVTRGNTWNMLVDVENETFWLGDDVFSPESVNYDEVDLDGEPTGRSVTLPTPGWSVALEGGAFVASVLGTTYRIDPDGHVPLAEGELIAISAQVLVVRACDDDLQCGVRVIDRATGEARWLPPGPGQAERTYLPLHWYFGGRREGSISPDGRWMVAADATFAERTGLLDLASGEFVGIDELRLDGPRVSWTWGPEGRLAFFVRGGVPWAYDVASNEAFRLSPDRLWWANVVVRRPVDAP